MLLILIDRDLILIEFIGRTIKTDPRVTALPEILDLFPELALSPADNRRHKDHSGTFPIFHKLL